VGVFGQPGFDGRQGDTGATGSTGFTGQSCAPFLLPLPNSHRPPHQTRHGQDGPVRPPDALRRRAHLSGGRADSVHTATPDTTRRSCLCRVWCAGVNRTIAANVFRLQVSCRRPSRVVEDPIHTTEADTTQTGLFCRVCVSAWRCELALRLQFFFLSGRIAVYT